jgi:hypothetical protein
MTAPERSLDEVAPEESRAAQDQYVHLCPPPEIRAPGTSVSRFTFLPR